VTVCIAAIHVINVPWQVINEVHQIIKAALLASRVTEQAINAQQQVINVADQVINGTQQVINVKEQTWIVTLQVINAALPASNGTMPA
jgi:hypothetical protein